MVGLRINACLFVLLTSAQANMYDVIEPTKLPPKECDKGCAPWADQGPDITKLWNAGK